MYGAHWHPRRCRPVSRALWFLFGAGAASWYFTHKGRAGWYEARHCGRDRIPQNAYPAPGAPTAPSLAADSSEGSAQSTPGTVDKWDRWGWGHWGKGSWPGQENAPRYPAQNQQRPEGAWGPPIPLPASSEKSAEKDVVQQATETITELSEATLNNLLVTVESLKAKLVEHRIQREQQERELEALRNAKFKQFEEWQRQQEQLLNHKKDEPPRRLV